MTDEDRPWIERSVTGNQRVFAHLQCYDMDYSHTYIFIPKALQERKDDVLRCVFREQVKNYKICFVDRTSDSPSNLW